MTTSGATGQPLVTIVTPSFQQGRFLRDAIESVLAQDYPAIEYIVVDGGSTDETLEVLAGYGERVRWTSGPDAGQADAIRRAFEGSSGDILAWLNADDRYRPGAVARGVEALLGTPQPALVYGNAWFIDPAGGSLGPCAQVEPWDFDRLVGVLDFVVQPATFFRREAYAAVGGLDASLRYCMDYDLWIRLGARYPVAFVPEVLAEVRLHPETKTASGGLGRLLEVERMVARHGRRRLPRSFQREMVETAGRELAAALRRGDATRARRALRAGGSYVPLLVARRAARVLGLAAGHAP